jgi:hypothetical protein
MMKIIHHQLFFIKMNWNPFFLVHFWQHNHIFGPYLGGFFLNTFFDLRFVKYRMQECKIGVLKSSFELVTFMVHVFVEQFALKSLLHLRMMIRLKNKK